MSEKKYKRQDSWGKTYRENESGKNTKNKIVGGRFTERIAMGTELMKNKIVGGGHTRKNPREVPVDAL